MFKVLPDILTPAEIERLRAIAAGARFQTGRLSNPHSKVKNNLQIDHADPAYGEATTIMSDALGRNTAFTEFTLPRRVAPPMLAKYAPGMKYGMHSDAAFLPVGAQPLRSDLSCTLFIADPEGYGGGELAIQLGAETLTFKGAPGSAVVYPSNSLHEVRAVTSGERLVGLTFVESRIRDPAQREMLHHLNDVAALEGFNISWDSRVRLQFVANNLLRMWGEAS
jgi:PKHD-type hydroxylase